MVRLGCVTESSGLVGNVALATLLELQLNGMEQAEVVINQSYAIDD
jgi:hypothetical protein